MGLLRKLAVIASGAAVVAGMGVVYAGAASANTTPTTLCTQKDPNGGLTFCAAVESSGINPWGTNYQAEAADWYYPTPGERTIRDTTDGKCMLVDTGTSGYNISMHACGSTPAYEFIGVALSGGKWNFVSYYNTNDCLAYDADNDGFHLFNCNSSWYETFST